MKAKAIVSGFVALVIAAIIAVPVIWFFVIHDGKIDNSAETGKTGSYAITYNLDGGENSAFNVDTYNKGDSITLYPARKAGYEFSGWKDEKGNVLEVIENMEEDKLLTAQWAAKRFAIRYFAVLDGEVYDIMTDETYSKLKESGVRYPTSYLAGENISIPMFRHTLEIITYKPNGEMDKKHIYSVLGYYSDRSCTKPVYLIKSEEEDYFDINVYVKLNYEETEYYTVNYDTGGKGAAISAETVKFGTLPKLPNAKSISTPCVAMQWDELWGEDGEFSGNNNSHENELPIMPIYNALELDDYEFLGWFTADGEKVSAETFKDNKDITLYAKWSSLWTKNY